jgi:MYXO-CTERM domain-containing protein
MILDVPSQYATPCAAIAASQANDEVDISPGTYTDTCEITTQGLTVKGVGGMPKIDLTGGTPAQEKGIYVVSADNVTIENLELTGASISDAEGGNGAGLRITGHGVVVHGCYIHDNQDGILAAPIVDGGTITIEYTDLSHNGLGDACDQGGCVHNVYISKTSSTVRYDKTVFQFNWSHDLASDTSDKGHLLKSRSRETDVLYNQISGETGHDSYEVDIPNGGLAVVVGNVIEKGSSPDNSTLLYYGEEGYDITTTNALYVVNNTFVNDFTSGTFINVESGAPAGFALTAHNNLIFGPGTLSSTGSLSADNLLTASPMFVDPTNYNYQLLAGSPAIGKAVSAGSEGSFSLTPVDQMVPPPPPITAYSPVRAVMRAGDGDLGAFEFGNPSDAGSPVDSGVPTSDAGSGSGSQSTGSSNRGSGTGSLSGSGSGTGSHSGSGSVSASSSGDVVAPGSSSTGGCGCGVAGSGPTSRMWVLALSFAAALMRRRRPSRDPESRAARPRRDSAR